MYTANENSKNELKSNECYINATPQERNNATVKYMPLIHKIARQLTGYGKLEYSDVFSLAEEGFALALNRYDPKKSKLTFPQYAAYIMRGKIMNGCAEQMNCVKINGYVLYKLKNNGVKPYFTTPIDSLVNVPYKYTSCEIDESPNIHNNLCEHLSMKFNTDDIYIFKSFYGVGDVKQKSATQLANEFGISVGCISQKNKAIIKYIKNSRVLKDLLSNLL